jgi:hypothetical protein
VNSPLLATPFHAPALSDAQRREYGKFAFNDEHDYDGRIDKEIRALESAMKNLLHVVSPEAMIQAIERYAREDGLWKIVLEHETGCPKPGA